MKMHKFTVYVLDFDKHGSEEYECVLNNNKYITGQIYHDGTAEIGDWSDDHPLNKTDAKSDRDKYFFKESKVVSQTNVDAVHALLDELIIDFPGEFPDGPNFLDELQTQLKEYVEDGQIDDWSIHPMASEGFKIVLTQGSESSKVLRNPDDGGKL